MPGLTSRRRCKSGATFPEVGKNISIGNCAKSSDFSHCTVRTKPVLAEVTMSERDLFIAALKFTEPAERAAWLDRQCHGDARLRERIDVLLKAFDQAGSLLENPAVAVGLTTDEPITEGAGTII